MILLGIAVYVIFAVMFLLLHFNESASDGRRQVWENKEPNR